MNAHEYAQFRAAAELYRRCKRENEKLRDRLALETEASRVFDQQDQDVFNLVHMNRARMKGDVEVKGGC